MDKDMLEILNLLKKVKTLETEVKLIKEMVPIRKWVNDPYYSGPLADSMYPFWKKVMCDIFDTDCIKNVIIIDGAIGIGKTTIGTAITMRLIYELSCYNLPQSLLGLMATSTIAFIYFSVSLPIAKKTGFGDLQRLIDSTPYFIKEFPRDTYLNSSIKMPKQIDVDYGSRLGSAIGTNVLGALIDEGNFMEGDGKVATSTISEVKSQAQIIADGITRRSKSRYESVGGDPSRLIVLSSSKFNSSFVQGLKDKHKDDPHAYILNASHWEVKNIPYGKNPFYVFIGDGTIEPSIIDDEKARNIADYYKVKYNKNSNIQALLLKALPEYVILVPDFYRKSFEADIVGSIQDIAGCSTQYGGKLFANRAAFNKCIGEKLKHPFIQQEFILSTDDDKKGIDFLRLDFKPDNPMMPRYFHIDQSLGNDSTGIACSYIDRYDDIGNPIIVLEWYVRIIPPHKPAQIDIEKCRALVLDYCNKFRLAVGYISYDSFGSEQSLQWLKKNNYNCGTQSVDKTDEQYVDFCNLIYQNRISFYTSPIFEKELFNVEHDKVRHRVDHPTTSSKDVLDSIVGSVHNALSAERTYTIYDDIKLIM